MNIKWLSFDWLLARKKVKPTPYDSMIFTGNSVVIVRGKDILTADADLVKYLTVKNLTHFEDIIAILYPPQSIQVKNTIEDVVNAGTDLLDLSVFEKEEGFFKVEKSVFFKGLESVEIPKPVLLSFGELLNKGDKEGLETLKKFTLNLILNPDPVSRLHTMAFVKKYNVKLTNNGNIVMFRRICKVDNTVSNIDSGEITKLWLKAKAWKKAPKSFDVYKGENGYSIRESYKTESTNKQRLGNLKDLYKSISSREDNRYTDNFTRTYDIRLGEVYRIKKEDIIENRSGSCGGTLHVASGGKDGYDYKSFGDTPVVVLVNPRYVHRLDTGFSGKIGVKEMFVVGVTEQDHEDNYLNVSEDTLVEFDNMYNLPIFEEEVYNSDLSKEDLDLINEMLLSDNIEIDGIQ